MLCHWVCPTWIASVEQRRKASESAPNRKITACPTIAVNVQSKRSHNCSPYGNRNCMTSSPELTLACETCTCCGRWSVMMCKSELLPNMSRRSLSHRAVTFRPMHSMSCVLCTDSLEVVGPCRATGCSSERSMTSGSSETSGSGSLRGTRSPALVRTRWRTPHSPHIRISGTSATSRWKQKLAAARPTRKLGYGLRCQCHVRVVTSLSWR